jgi:phage terminase large subunit-like protein
MLLVLQTEGCCRCSVPCAYNQCVMALYMLLQAQKLLASVKGGGSAWEAVLQDARQSKVSQLVLLTN